MTYRILNPLSEAVDRTCALMDASRVCNPLSHNGNSLGIFFFNVYIYTHTHSGVIGLVLVCVFMEKGI